MTIVGTKSVYWRSNQEWRSISTNTVCPKLCIHISFDCFTLYENSFIPNYILADF